jgi:hypothetical protein
VRLFDALTPDTLVGVGALLRHNVGGVRKRLSHDEPAANFVRVCRLQCTASSRTSRAIELPTHNGDVEWTRPRGVPHHL